MKLPLALLLAALSCLPAAADPVIDSMDAPTFRPSSEKAQVAPVEGRDGGALKFTFSPDARSVFVAGRGRATADWDRAAGFAFWVKGDGSKSLGGLQIVWNEDYAVRYDYAFPIDGTEWKKVTVAWRDLIPALPVAAARPLDPAAGNAPSKLGPLWFGKWWYWGEYPAHSYAVDDIRLETDIPLDTKDYRPAGAPLARVQAKLKAGKPITIVTMGDSLTASTHWANRTVRWPEIVRERLQAKYGGTVTVVNPAIGGTQLRQNLVLMPRWLASAPEPDLVTVLFGYNDWDAGARGPFFRAAMVDAVDRIRRATGGKADILLIATAPALSRWDAMAELSAAVRDAAKERNAGLADIDAAFRAKPEAVRAGLFVHDRVHLSPAGHGLVADTVLTVLETGMNR